MTVPTYFDASAHAKHFVIDQEFVTVSVRHEVANLIRPGIEISELNAAHVVSELISYGHEFRGGFMVGDVGDFKAAVDMAL